MELRKGGSLVTHTGKAGGNQPGGKEKGGRPACTAAGHGLWWAKAGRQEASGRSRRSGRPLGTKSGRQATVTRHRRAGGGQRVTRCGRAAPERRHNQMHQWEGRGPLRPSSKGCPTYTHALSKNQ